MPGSSRHPRRLARWLLAGGAFVLAGVSLRASSVLRETERDLLSQAQRTGALERQPDLARGLIREIDPERSRLLLARALLIGEIDRRWTGGLTAAEKAQQAGAGLERLQRAGELATAVLKRRPASWEASMILGAARYFHQARQRDERPWFNGALWEDPLRAAIAIAPGYPEPRRLLAAMRLDTWFAQSDDERRETRGLVREGLRDPLTFSVLLVPWLRSASDPADALAQLPAEPAAYAAARDAYAQGPDWAGYMAAETGRRRLLPADLDRRLTQAETAERAGQRDQRPVFLHIVADAPVETRYAATVERAMTEAPAGSTDSVLSPELLRWLRWGVQAWQQGRPGLSPLVLARLEAAAEELSSEESALLALATHDLPAAERLERHTGGIWSAAWTPYFIAKAELLAEREPQVAARALAEIHRDQRDGHRYWQARRAVALGLQDAAQEREADERLRQLATMEWPATAWRYDAGQASFEGLSSSPSSAFEITFHEVPRNGSAIEVSIDGESWGPAIVRTTGALRLPATLAAGGHRFAVLQRAGGRALPGELRLLP
ncbi:MAG: hypothetical protein ABI609_13230 [Acidobacteriota bacterium]